MSYKWIYGFASTLAAGAATLAGVAGATLAGVAGDALAALFIGVTGALLTTSAVFLASAGFGATGAALAVEAVELAAATLAAGFGAAYGRVADGLTGAAVGLVWVAAGLASGLASGFFWIIGAAALTSILAGAAFLAKS